MRTRPGRGQAGPPRCCYLTRAQVRTRNGGCGLAVTDSDGGGAGPRVLTDSRGLGAGSGTADLRGAPCNPCPSRGRPAAVAFDLSSALYRDPAPVTFGPQGVPGSNWSCPYLGRVPAQRRDVLLPSRVCQARAQSRLVVEASLT